MITQLLIDLQAVEKKAVAVLKAAEAAYHASIKARATVEETAALDPGRHQVALGAIRTAIAHFEQLVPDPSTPSNQPAAPDPAKN